MTFRSSYKSYPHAIFIYLSRNEHNIEVIAELHGPWNSCDEIGFITFLVLSYTFTLLFDIVAVICPNELFSSELRRYLTWYSDQHLQNIVLQEWLEKATLFPD
jgi:hypothetical protein